LQERKDHYQVEVIQNPTSFVFCVGARKLVGQLPRLKKKLGPLDVAQLSQ
jgi:hypothetical protein